jgi:hypothetical protein
MKVLLTIALALLCSLASFAGTPGEFRGTVVSGPEQSGQWVYVEGYNHSVRRVDVRRAKIRYDSEVPQAERQKPVPKSLAVGMQIRVTAEQDDAGEWRAIEVEILKGSAQDEKKATIPTTSQS